MPTQWERIFESVDEGVIALDAEGRFLYANAFGAAVFGTEPDRLVGRMVADFTRQEATATLAGIIERTAEDVGSAQVEVYAPLTGKWHAVRSYRAASGVTVFLQDITDRKLAEDALRVSEAKFAGIVDISADAIISIDADQRIVHFNKGAEEIFGWKAAEMIGQTLDRLIPERFRAGHPRQIRNFAASPVAARRMGERREIAGLRRNGAEFPAEASISKISIGDQRIFTVVLRDVSERKEREETYRRLYKEAQRAIAARDDVLSFVSHDLGNPLAAVRIASAVLLKRVQPEDPDYVHVAGIREAVEQAQRLIRDLLDIQKIEAGKLPLHFETLDIGTLIDDAVQSLRPLIDERELRIERKAGSDRARAEADRERVLQALTNLLGNAVKFSPPGGTIAVAAAQQGDEVVLSIRDAGPGIAADDLPHIFDRYFQAQKRGKVGHGLGLSIVQAIARAHAGRAWAESTPGVGSTFYFALPTAAPGSAGSD